MCEGRLSPGPNEGVRSSGPGDHPAGIYRYEGGKHRAQSITFYRRIIPNRAKGNLVQVERSRGCFARGSMDTADLEGPGRLASGTCLVWQSLSLPTRPSFEATP
jgi:hypothetical protein